MSINQPAFRPEPSKTVNIPATTASANVQVQPSGVNARHVRIYNSGSVTAFIKEGQDNTVSASAAVDFPVGPGRDIVISSRSTWMAAVTGAAGTCTVYFTPGEGLI